MTTTEGRRASYRDRYHDITKRGFAQETVPQKIFSGAGYLPFSDGADPRRSKYRWL